MSLYGHTYINIEALKRWANSLSVDELTQVDVGGDLIKLEDITREILEIQTQGFTQLVNQLKPEDDWRNCLGIISDMFYNAFVRIDNSSIRVADFYECLIVPSNIKTYKKIIQGFDYTDTGAINIRDKEGNTIAIIGIKSDLIWATFYHYFINNNDNGSIDYTYSNHKQYLSIQLFDVEDIKLDKLFEIVNEILLSVSMEYDMEFRIFEVDSKFKEIGDSSTYDMQYTPTGFEQIPMLYLTNAINSTDERLAYLSYYQVIEYFFVRAQNYHFLNEFTSIDTNNINHNEFRKVLAGYKKINNERASLRLVLLRAVDITKFKNWLYSNPDYQKIYCSSNKLKIDISKVENKIIDQLVERVYSYRCSIAHAKGDIEEYIAIPLLSRDEIANELPLLKYLAFEVIGSCSE